MHISKCGIIREKLQVFLVDRPIIFQIFSGADEIL